MNNDNFKLVKRIEKRDNSFLPCILAIIYIGLTSSTGLEDPTKPQYELSLHPHYPR